MNIFDLLESPGMGRPRDTKGVQSAADQSAASVIGSGTTEREAKKKPVTMMGQNVKEAVEEAAVKPNFKMPPESLQDKMYRQHQELRKKRGAPSPEEYKERIAQKQKEIDDLKEGILDRAAPKMPKPRNPADQVLRNKVNAGGRHLDKKRRQDLNPKHKHKDPMAEGEVLQFPKSPQDKNVRAKLEQRLLAAFNQIVDYADDNGIDILEKNAPLYSKLFSKYDTEDATLDPEQAMARNEPIEVVAQVVKEVEHIAKHIDEYLDNMWGDTFNESSVDEGWKSAVAGAALAGSMALGGMAHAAEPVVGMGQSQNMQMAVDMAKHNARVKYLKTIHGDNFQDKQMPEHRYGKLELKPNDKGGYVATVPLIVDAETQNESLRPGERHHFETDPVTGKRVYKGIRGDQQDAPQRAKDDPAARADQERKAHIAHDRGLTEQAVKITDYELWSDEVKALGGEIHPQKDRNVLVAQSWDGEEIGKFHLGKSMGFINQSGDLDETIRKMGSQYRLLSKKGKNLGTFDSKAGAEKHEREVQYFKHKNMEEDTSAIKKKISKYEELALAANRAGDDAKCKMYQKKIQALKSQGVAEAEIPSIYSKQVPPDMEHRARYKCPNCGIANKVQDWAANDNECPTCLEPLPHGLNQMPLKYQGVAEGWKGKVAGAALAGAAALGGGDVDAQNIDLPGPQVSYIAHIQAEFNGREISKTVNLGPQYESKEQAEQDLEEYMQSKGITRYNIRVEQSYDQPGGYGQRRRTSGYATGGYSATGPISAPGLGDMIAGKVSREIRAGIPSKGGYATGGTNKGQRPRDGSQWWRDQLPQIMKEDELAEGKPENPSRRGFLKALAVAAVLSSTPVAKLMSDASSKMSIVKHRGKLGKYQGSDIDCTGYKIGKKQFYITVDGEPYTVQTGTGAGFMGQDFKNLDFKSDTYLQKIAPWLNTKDEYILQIADYDIELYDQNNQKIFPAKDQQQTKEMYSNGFIDAIIGYLDVYQTSAIQQMAEVPSQPHYPEELPAIDKGSKGVSAIASKAAGNDPLHIARLASLAKSGYDAITKKPDAQQSAPSFNAPAALPAPSDDNVLRPELNKQKEKSSVKRRGVDEDIKRYVEALSRAGYEVTEEKVRLDPKCWTGKKIGNPKTKMKGGVRVNNCVPK